jgi:hypothetical protein
VKTHPYLRAYIAGIAIPTAALPFGFAVFCVARFICRVDVPLERALVFPLALVPSVWGLWNVLFIALHGHRWLSLGGHGALLPLILAPAGLFIARLVELPVPGFLPTAVAAFLPVGLAAYYLLWKFAVRYLNEMLGIA